jgi:hypothetical protein
VTKIAVVTHLTGVTGLGFAALGFCGGTAADDFSGAAGD